MLLADLGAEVVKIEPPDGDQFRSYPPGFEAVNMNKRSVCIDLRSNPGREALLRLVEDADVLLENFRPGVMARLGLDVQTLHARNPRLIVCSISGFGADGPYRTRPAYDTGAMALSGFMSLLVDPARPAVVGPPIADGITGMYACYGILGALFERERTGRGRLVESSMLESLIAFTHQAFHHYFATGEVQEPTTRPRVAQAYVMKCSDDRLIGLHLSTEDKVWRGLLSAVESPLIAADPRFRSYEGRVEHYSDLTGALADVFVTRPSAYWMERLHEQEVPFAPVYGTDEVLADPQVRHLGSIHEVAQAGAEPFRGHPPTGALRRRAGSRCGSGTATRAAQPARAGRGRLWRDGDCRACGGYPEAFRGRMMRTRHILVNLVSITSTHPSSRSGRALCGWRCRL